jgi:hypothetical protein
LAEGCIPLTALVSARKAKSRQPNRLLPFLITTADYRDFDVVSSFRGFAELPPEPVVPTLELVALAFCALDFCAFELMALAWCRSLWLAMCFFELFVVLVVSSFNTLVAGFELVPE